MSAQVIVDPAVASERNDGGWIYWIAIALGALGLVVIIRLIIKYMRYAPRFSKDEETLKVVRADRVQHRRGSSPAATSTCRRPRRSSWPRRPCRRSRLRSLRSARPHRLPRPHPLRPSRHRQPRLPPPRPRRPLPQPWRRRRGRPARRRAAGPGRSRRPEERPEVSMDQEAYEAALKELLDAGTDRRIAEGKARRAGMIAARKKAAGEA